MNQQYTKDNILAKLSLAKSNPQSSSRRGNLDSEVLIQAISEGNNYSQAVKLAGSRAKDKNLSSIANQKIKQLNQSNEYDFKSMLNEHITKTQKEFSSRDISNLNLKELVKIQDRLTMIFVRLGLNKKVLTESTIEEESYEELREQEYWLSLQTLEESLSTKQFQGVLRIVHISYEIYQEQIQKYSLN